MLQIAILLKLSAQRQLLRSQGSTAIEGSTEPSMTVPGCAKSFRKMWCLVQTYEGYTGDS